MTTRYKRWAALLVVSVFARPSYSGEPAASTGAAAFPINLPMTIRLALDQPATRAATHEVAASAALVDQAGHIPNPELAYLREGQDAGTRTTTIQINQPIELGGKRQARMVLARGAADFARTELQARRQDTRADAIAAYYEVLVGQRRQALAKESAALASKSVEVAGKRVAAGKISPIDETKARLAAVDATTALNHATAALAIARTKLGALIGKPADILVLSDQSYMLPQVRPLAALLSEASASMPVKRARSRLASQEAQVNVERAARIPDVTLSVGTQRDDQVGRRQAVFGVSMPLPLFNRNEGNLRAALRRADKGRDDLAAAETSTASDLTAAYTRFETAKEEATLLERDVVPSAKSAFELTLKGFEYGKFSFLDVLDAQRTWVQVQSRQWDTVLDAYRAYADIERIAGTDESNKRDQ